VKPLNALIRRVEMTQRGVGTVAIRRVRESGVNNGSRVKNSPGFGFETELSGEPEIERVGVGFCAESKEQAGSFDLVMVA
jgi:hypothetical protein